MNRNLTTQVIELGNNDLAMRAMRERRAVIFAEIQAAEETQQQIPEVQLKEMLNELFDLNIAIGDVNFEDKDGDNG